MYTQEPTTGLVQITALHWTLVVAVALLGSMACNAVEMLTTSTPRMTPTVQQAVTETKQESTATPAAATGPFPPGEAIDVLPQAEELDYLADLSLTFEGQNLDGEPSAATIQRREVRRREPHLYYTHTNIEATAVPGLAPSEAPEGEIAQTVLIKAGTLHLLLDSTAASTCFQEELPEGFQGNTSHGRKGLLQVEQYVHAASSAVELTSGDTAGTFNNRPAAQYRTESALIWTGTRASMEVWIEPDTGWLPAAYLEGKGLLPPYGEGKFRIEVRVERLEEDFEVEIPDTCRLE